MRAVIVKKYGGPEVALLAEVPKPVITKPNQICIQVITSSINSGDARLRRADPWFVRLMFGLRGPRKQVLGAVFAGIVESVGNTVTNYKVGDRVYGMPESFMGGHAEYIIVTDTTPMGLMSEKMSFRDAAALPFGGTTALYFLEDIELNGKTVFINGASGAVGLSFLQLAKVRGAKVTAVSTAKNFELLTALGADALIDYTETNIYTLTEAYDVVIDCVNTIPVSQIKLFVKVDGTVILIAGLVKEMFLSRKLKNVRVRIGSAKVTSSQFLTLTDLYQKQILRPVIDSVFALTDVVTAYARVDSGRKVGSVVLMIAEGECTG